MQERHGVVIALDKWKFSIPLFSVLYTVDNAALDSDPFPHTVCVCASVSVCVCQSVCERHPVHSTLFTLHSIHVLCDPFPLP